MRKLSTTLAIVGLLSPAGAQALGVGEIRLQSALNQSFRAEIPLVLSRENLGDLKVSLAPPSEFAKAGVDRPHVLTRLRFEPVRKPDGSYVIRVASNDLIHEPFISFLLEMTWPEGRMLRSFTVLLDPPDVMAKTTLPSSAPRLDRGEAVSAVGATVANRGYPDEPTEARDDGSTYGPVRRNEKLWSIAEKVKPDVSVTTEQMVMALLRYNPNAFSAPNVNALDSGAVLRIPDEGYIQSLSASDARREFYQQGGQHSGRGFRHAAPSRVAKSSPPPADALPAATTNTRASDVSSGALPSAAVGVTRPGVSSRAVEALKGETEAMGVRLAELERRISEMQTRLDEKDALLAQLQAGLEAGHAADHSATGELRGNIPPASAPQAAPNAAQPGDAGSSQQSGGAVGDTASTSAAKPSVVPAGIPTQEASPQSPAQAPNTSAVTQTMPGGASGIHLNQPPAQTKPAVAVDTEEAESGLGAVGAFGIAMATALGGLLFWRRKLAQRASQEEAQLETFDEAGNAIHRDDGGAVGDLIGTNMTDGMDAPETFADDLTAEPATHAGNETKGDSDEVDPVFESDVYLAYGRYKQAEEAMQNAIQEHPERDAYRLKLLEIYLAGENKEQFEEYAAKLRQRNPDEDDAFWQKVAEMGQKLCPESPLFRAEAEVPVNETPADTLPEAAETFDETDRLIADLKSFSLGAMDKDSPLVPDTMSDASETAKASQTLHEIEWAPVDFTAPAHNPSVPDPVEDRAAPIDQDHVIGFDSSGQPVRHEGGSANGGDSASQSIDEILKELSAIHYKRHSEVEELAVPDTERPLSGTTSDSRGLDDLDVLGFPEINAQPDMRNAELDVDFPEIDDLETRLDLARAYADLDDYPQAIALLDEVIQKGSEQQKAEAAMLMGRFSQA